MERKTQNTEDENIISYPKKKKIPKQPLFINTDKCN